MSTEQKDDMKCNTVFRTVLTDQDSTFKLVDNNKMNNRAICFSAFIFPLTSAGKCEGSHSLVNVKTLLLREPLKARKGHEL